MRTPSSGIPAFCSWSASREIATAFFAREAVRRQLAGLAAALATFAQKYARGFREIATCSTRPPTPAARHARAESAGKPAQCLILFSRSSSMANARSPSASSAADESPWNAFRPRMFMKSTGCFLEQFVELDIHEQAEPEPLQKVKDRALLAV